MNIVHGLIGAPGCALGTVVVLKKESNEVIKRSISDFDAEINKLEIARKSYNEQLQKMLVKAQKEVGKSGADIFMAYQEILSDDVFFEKVIERVKNEKVNIEFAINEETNEVVALFENLDDEYLKERSADISNVCMELIDEIQGSRKKINVKDSLGKDIIVVANELTPVDTMKLDKKFLKGFITEKGGVTSHTVILAKTLGIPAVVGLEGILEKVDRGIPIIIYGEKGQVIIKPDDLEIQKYIGEKEKFNNQKNLFESCKNKSAITIDGIKMRVNINSGDVDSIEDFNSNECDGVGLFRTEFLYMNQTYYPTEEEQFEVYKKMAIKTGGNEVIIRTLDIGGDKKIDYMDLPKEDNPFLGYRAIRLCLDRIDIFKTQMKAILRASAYGNVKMMFPMIVNLEEVLKAKEILEESKAELEKAGIIFDKDISVGIMIETPAAVLISDILAKEVDFFSIGSNDLIQYTTATDRMNNRVQGLYDSCNISVLRSIQMVCDNAKKNNVEVGICGEIASETMLVPLWVAMGIDELSVVPAEVSKVKYLVNHLDRSELKKKMTGILNLGKIENVRQTLGLIVKPIINR